MEKPMEKSLKRCLIVGIITLLVLSSMPIMNASSNAVNSENNISGNSSDDIIIQGTMGENDWYVSAVVITLVGGNYTYYTIDGGNWTAYTNPFIIDSDGFHELLVTFDFEEAFSVDIKIDKTAPVGHLTLKRVGIFKWLLLAHVTDNTSGVCRVEFYIDNSLIGIATTVPYEYTWAGFMLTILLKYIVYGDEYLPLIKPYDCAGNTPVNP